MDIRGVAPNQAAQNNGLEQTGRAGVARISSEPVFRVAPCSSTQCSADRGDFEA